MTQFQPIRLRVVDAKRRIHSILMVLVLAGAIYGAVNCLFFIGWGNSGPSFLQGDKGTATVVLANQRYADYQLGQASGATLWRQVDPETRHYGLILGTSSVRSNLDPSVFKQSARSDMEWIVSGYFGPSMIPMNRLITHLARFPDFKPEIVILGIHPYMLKGYESWGLKIADQKHFPPNWIFSNRNYFKAYFVNFLMSIRFKLFEILEMARLPAMHRPLSDPWQPQQENIDEDFNEGNWEKAKIAGTVDWAISDAGYDMDAPELKEFIASIDTILNVWKAPVYVVLMPQAPYLNKDMPARALTVIDTALATRFNGKVPLVDLSHNYPVEDFFDSSHLDVEAKKKFSTDLGELFRGRF
jgi:hypothetical protein